MSTQEEVQPSWARKLDLGVEVADALFRFVQIRAIGFDLIFNTIGLPGLGREEAEQGFPDAGHLASATGGPRMGQYGGVLGEHRCILHKGGIREVQVLIEDGEPQPAILQGLAVGRVLFQHLCVDGLTQDPLSYAGEAFAEVFSGDADNGVREHGCSCGWARRFDGPHGRRAGRGSRGSGRGGRPWPGWPGLRPAVRGRQGFLRGRSRSGPPACTACRASARRPG